MFGPTLAAVVVTRRLGGRSQLAWRRRLPMWRVPRRWYPVALALPVAVIAVALGLALVFGAPAPSRSAVVGALSALPVILVFQLVAVLGEEPGWRGFALPRLQARGSALRATVILSLFNVGWHLPLLLRPEGRYPEGTPMTPLLLWAFAIVVVYTWIYNHAGGSVVIVTLFHVANNTVAFVASRLVPASDYATLLWLWSTLWSVVAVVIVVTGGLAKKADAEEVTSRPAP